jgi:hypothetical protein
MYMVAFLFPEESLCSDSTHLDAYSEEKRAERELPLW